MARRLPRLSTVSGQRSRFPAIALARYLHCVDAGAVVLAVFSTRRNGNEMWNETNGHGYEYGHGWNLARFDGTVLFAARNARKVLEAF